MSIRPVRDAHMTWKVDGTQKVIGCTRANIVLPLLQDINVSSVALSMPVKVGMMQADTSVLHTKSVNSDSWWWNFTIIVARLYWHGIICKYVKCRSVTPWRTDAQANDGKIFCLLCTRYVDLQTLHVILKCFTLVSSSFAVDRMLCSSSNLRWWFCFADNAMVSCKHVHSSAAMSMSWIFIM